VLVGPEKKSFSIHKNIICNRSPFFQAACAERWQASTPKALELPEDDADTFDVYLHTAYTGHVDVGDLEDAWVGEETLPEYDRRSLRLVNSYVLADKLWRHRYGKPHH
jgi:hypothetical protein